MGSAYAYDVDATGTPAPTYGLTLSPSGMTIDPVSGVIGWTPVTSGAFDVTVAATNSEGSDSQIFAISVSAPVAPDITSTAVTAAVGGSAYAYDVDASGSPAPTYSLTLNPAGMTIGASQ